MDLTKIKSPELKKLFLDRGFHVKQDVDEEVPRHKLYGPFYIFGQNQPKTPDIKVEESARNDL